MREELYYIDKKMEFPGVSNLANVNDAVRSQ